MSVVNLAARTTTDASIFNDNAFSDRSLLLVSEGTLIENFSIDLTIGSRWSERYGGKTNAMFRLDTDQGAELPARSSIVVEVAEDLGVPHNLYGLIIPTGSLFLDQGIIIAAAKIEPSFKGRLKLRLVNTTSEPRTIRRGMKIATAVFHSTEVTRFQADKSKGVVDIDEPIRRQVRLIRWFSANGWKAVPIAVSVLALLVAAATLYISRLTYLRASLSVLPDTHAEKKAH